MLCFCFNLLCDSIFLMNLFKEFTLNSRGLQGWAEIIDLRSTWQWHSEMPNLATSKSELWETRLLKEVSLNQVRVSELLKGRKAFAVALEDSKRQICWEIREIMLLIFTVFVKVSLYGQRSYFMLLMSVCFSWTSKREKASILCVKLREPLRVLADFLPQPCAFRCLAFGLCFHY